MNELIKVEKVNGILVTDSRRVATELGVEHYHLLEKIDTYVGKFNTPETSGLFYIPSNYKASNGKSNRNYLITEKGIAQLVGGYSGAVDKAFQLNVDYINEFEEEISQQNILPSEYTNSRGKRYPMFNLTYSQAKQVLKVLRL